MLSSRRRTRLQQALLLLSLCSSLYYVVLYRPLARRAAELDQPLAEVWRDLVAAGPAGVLDSGAIPRLELARETAREGVAQLNALERTIAARLALDPATRAAMAEPFQLIAFQNERQTRLEDLIRRAAAAKVGIGAGVAAGFPEYTAEQVRPEWLWPQLLIAEHLVVGAIHSGVSTVAVVRLPPVQIHRSGTTETQWLTEVLAEIEVRGSADKVNRFLEQLPLTPPEIQARGLAKVESSKPVMFIRGIVLRKEGRDRPDHVRLELVASMFVLPELSQPGS